MLTLIAVTFGVAVAGIASPAVANSGSASISHWRAAYFSTAPNDSISTVVWVSNATPSDIQVTLRLRDYEGRWYGDATFIPSVTAGGFSSCNAKQNVCTLAGGRTGYLHVAGTHTSSFNYYGYAKVEWTALGSEVEQVALLVDGNVAYIAQGDVKYLPISVTRGPF